MTTKQSGRPVRMLVFVLMLAAAVAVGYVLGGGNSVPSPDRHDHEGAMEAKQETSVWTCSMHPQIRLPQPGKCPICFMDLIPAQKDSRTSEADTVSLRQITLTPEARKLAEVEVEPVARRSVAVETRMVGKVDYDETRLGYITTWMAGRIDKLHIDYTGSKVNKGQPMALIYSPELLTAQAELIQAVKTSRDLAKKGLERVRDAAEQTEQAAREKLRLLGFTDRQIEEVVQRGEPSDRITLHAPMGGVVIKKDVFEGMYVQTGTRLYTIADLSRVWVVVEAYESDLPRVKLGQLVEFRTDAHPGEVFKGVVVYVNPIVNEKTRTVSVRLDVPNPGGNLKPGMFVRAVKRTSSERAGEELVIPVSAPLLTGKRAIVYVRVPDKEGVYEGREIVLGSRAGDYYIVKSGLLEGELVVTKGNFKVDSAVQLMAKPSMMNPEGVQAVTGHHLGAGTAAHGGSSERPVPAAFAFQVSRIAEAYATLESTVQQSTLQESREAYRAFGRVLHTVDPSSLKDRSALVWKEAAMLLRNDSMLGGEADTEEEALRLFRTLSDHYRIVHNHFRIDRILQDQSVSASVPAVFKKNLGVLLQHYLALQEALAHDNFADAVKAGEAFSSTLKSLDPTVLTGAARDAWGQALTRLLEGAERVTAPRSIETVRDGFEALSVGMAEAVERLGVDVKGPVYELYCSMAFNDKGAIWLQQDEDVRNPYFGSRMFKCGEVKRQLRGNPS